MARGGFMGPRTVLEGTHGFYQAFAPSVAPDFAPLLDDLGRRWVTDDLAFKPYACGTMTQPFIDCARRARAATACAPSRHRRRSTARSAEGTVHRLWEPLAVEAPAADAVCGEVQHAVLHGRRLLRRHAPASRSSPRRASPTRRCSRWRRRSATASIPPTSTRETSPATCAPRCATASTREYRQPHMRGGAQATADRRRGARASSWTTRSTAGWTGDAAARLLRATGQCLRRALLAPLRELRA